MKQKIVLGCLAVCMIFLMAVLYIYNIPSPEAKIIEYPDYSSIESISVSSNGEQIYLSDEECRILYSHIKTAKPIRMSINDIPYETPFFTVEIKSKDLSNYGRGYIYQENEEYYFEIPYVGVYKFLDLVK